MDQQEPRKQPESSFRGLYKHVKISVKTLDKMIIGGILAIVLILGYGIANNGYTVTFDSKGGSTVKPIEQDYNTTVTAPKDPTKTGYTFPTYNSEPSFWAKVNGDYVLPEKTYGMDPTRYVTVSYEFGICNDSVIENIVIENVTTPVAGEKPT